MPDGRFWSFLDLHFAKLRSARTPFFVCTSHLTHDAIVAWNTSRCGGRAVLVRGSRAGRRFVPMKRDLEAMFARQENVEWLL
jgi:hypothetical protein